MAQTIRQRGGVFTALVSVYVVLSVAAIGRSGYQIATKFSDAPLAFTLSALAAAVYVIATIGLIRSTHRNSRVVALVALSLEAVGVLAVGTLSLFQPELFPAPTVWSSFGQGYLFIPLVLPFVGLWWLRGGSRTGG